MKILIINGPNLDKLNLRDKFLYGDNSLDNLNKFIEDEFKEIEFTFAQSNSEAEIVQLIHRSTDLVDGVVLNPGAFSHTSIAIRDSIEICRIPIVEVHLSNLSSRENFRNVMITAAKTSGYVSGFHENSYLVAVYALTKIVSEKKI